MVILIVWDLILLIGCIRRTQISESAEILSNLLLHEFNFTEYTSFWSFSERLLNLMVLWRRRLLENAATFVRNRIGSCCSPLYLVFLDNNFLIIVWNVQLAQICLKLLIRSDLFVSSVNLYRLWLCFLEGLLTLDFNFLTIFPKCKKPIMKLRSFLFWFDF